MDNTASTPPSSMKGGYIKIENRFCTNEECRDMEVGASFHSSVQHVCRKCGAPTEFRRISMTIPADVGVPSLFGMSDVEVKPGEFISRAEWNARVAKVEREEPGMTLIRITDEQRRQRSDEARHNIVTNRRKRLGITEAEQAATDAKSRERNRERRRNGEIGG